MPTHIIPITVDISGDSFASNVQLNSAPQTGIINFHKFKSDTLTSGRFNNVNQMEIATADKNASQLKAAKKGSGRLKLGIPSIGIDTIRRNNPPKKSCEELRIRGLIFSSSLAMITLLIAEQIEPINNNITPMNSIKPVLDHGCLLKLIITTPAIPMEILTVFRKVISSSAMRKCAVNAEIRGEDPIKIAAKAPGIIVMLM